MGGQILEMVEIEEAVYGGTPKKKEEPKDTRMVVTTIRKETHLISKNEKVTNVTRLLITWVRRLMTPRKKQ